MKLYDATLPLGEGMVTFPGDPIFKMEPVFQRRKGDPFDLARLSMGTHIGTHVDAPGHYLDGGATVEAIPLEDLVGPGVVLDMRGRSKIDRRALEEAPLEGYKRVLFKTDNGPRLLEPKFHQDDVHLTESGARYLVELGVRLVGIDALSIERTVNPGAPVHHVLLSAGILVVEGAHLMEIPPGPYEVFCLPLKIQGGDGAPARLLLRKG